MIEKEHLERIPDLTVQALKKRVIESEERRELQSRSGKYPLIGFRRPGDKKAGDAEKAEDEKSSETVRADDPEGAKEIA